ncbi:hypothetical protein LMG28688_07192 [Paraburkholderia caffeinitolerans]|uniref:Uncharacterized protein n=1 Tax=Paraburkholderia caffeinitolerans TaxID=1723730 RepID=A0A6J5H069_9BURK|nr:hypothetical protein LMG28688_07192 [Paraburkholderia caffeinitolerans]
MTLLCELTVSCVVVIFTSCAALSDTSFVPTIALPFTLISLPLAIDTLSAEMRLPCDSVAVESFELATFFPLTTLLWLCCSCMLSTCVSVAAPIFTLPVAASVAVPFSRPIVLPVRLMSLPDTTASESPALSAVPVSASLDRCIDSE